MSRSATGTIRIGDESVPRDQFDERVAESESRFADHRTVAIVAGATLDTAVAVQAALSSGVTVVPVSPDAGEAERRHLLDDSGATLLVEGDLSTELSPTADAVSAAAALLLYTSGTTGAPKGVPITSEAIHACIEGLAEAWAWTPDDLVVHGLPLNHVHGLVLGLLGPLMIGSSLHHTGRPTPSAYAAAGGSLYFGVPTIWSRIAADSTAARELAGARLLVSGSAALPAPTFDRLRATCGRGPIERYGMTETLITLAARADAPPLRGSVGRALPGIEVRIRSEDGTPAPPDVIGSLEVRGPTVFAGYAGQMDATARSFTDDGWFRTGDIAVVDAQGFHRIVGRASTDLIKSGGYRIGAGEVEDALLSHPAVQEAAVVGEPDEDLGQRVVAYVVADAVDDADLMNHVGSVLSRHKRPRSVVFVDALPRNAMGKVDKTRLRP